MGVAYIRFWSTAAGINVFDNASGAEGGSVGVTNESGSYYNSTGAAAIDLSSVIYTSGSTTISSSDAIVIYNMTGITIYINGYVSPLEADVVNQALSSTMRFPTNPSTLSPNSSIAIHDGGSTTFLTFAAVCFPPFTKIETRMGLEQIVNLERGHEVKTQRGIVKVSKNMTTQTPGGASFVFFPKDCICEGFPSEDAYITEFHPIAIKNVEEDNKDVMHFIEARHFIDKFEGIQIKKLDTKTYHNLVFDTVEIFNVGGIKVFSHHPNNTPIKLRKQEFLGEVNERKPINKRYTFEKLLEDKKEDEDLGEFIKNIFIYN